MRTNIRLKVGANIRAFRIKRGLTQERLSEVARIDYKYLQKIEGKNTPALKIDTIDKLAKTLKVKVSMLVD